MAGEPLFVGSSRHFDLRLYYVPLWLIRSTNDHRLESFNFFFLRSSRVSRTTMRSRQMTAPVKMNVIGPDIWLR